MTNTIDPTVVMRGDVQIGTGNEILPYSVLIGPLVIGDNNLIGPHVTIGSPGSDTRNPRYDSSACRIEVGNRNIIREYTAVQKPCYGDITRIGDDCYLMQSVCVPHDAVLENKVVVSPMVVIAGIAQIMEGANLGISCSVHQYSVIGAYSIVAMGAAVTKNVRPFSRHIPGKGISVNTYAVSKYGFEGLSAEIEAYVIEGVPPTTAKVAELVARFERAHADSGRGVY